MLRLGPSQRFLWLGLTWGSEEGTIPISETRVLSPSIISVLDCAVSARYLSSLVGKFISGGAIFGNLFYQEK